MSAKKQRKPDWIDCTQAQVAACLGVSVNTVSMWASKGMPGSKGKYKVPEVVAWALSSGPWSKRQDSDDPLLSDGDSPGLERYRQAKAAIAELDLEERKGGLVSVEKVRTALGRLSSMLRRFGERLGKRHGNEPVQDLNDTLAEFESVIANEFGSSGTSDTAFTE